MNHRTQLAGRGMRPNRAREQFWRDLFKQFAASGQGVRTFCRARDLSEASFYYWRQTLARRDAAAGWGDRPPSTPPAFLPVRIASEGTGTMEIILGGGRRIRLRGPVDRTVLAEVINALESLSAGSVSC